MLRFELILYIDGTLPRLLRVTKLSVSRFST